MYVKPDRQKRPRRAAFFVETGDVKTQTSQSASCIVTHTCEPSGLYEPCDEQIVVVVLHGETPAALICVPPHTPIIRAIAIAFRNIVEAHHLLAGNLVAHRGIETHRLGIGRERQRTGTSLLDESPLLECPG